MVKLCFDYGHGGKDPGALYNGRKESIDNLSIGREVARRVRNFGIEVAETRTTDITVGLKERVDYANIGNYDYFISFHRNAFKPEVARGVETFVYPYASPKANKLAYEVQIALTNCGLKNRGVKKADFYVLRRTKMPAILVEIGFLDNTLDNNLLDINRQQIIDELIKAIVLTVLR